MLFLMLSFSPFSSDPKEHLTFKLIMEFINLKSDFFLFHFSEVTTPGCWTSCISDNLPNFFEYWGVWNLICWLYNVFHDIQRDIWAEILMKRLLNQKVFQDSEYRSYKNNRRKKDNEKEKKPGQRIKGREGRTKWELNLEVMNWVPTRKLFFRLLPCGPSWLSRLPTTGRDENTNLRWGRNMGLRGVLPEHQS